MDEVEAKRMKKGGRPKNSTIKANKLILENNIEAGLQYCAKKIIDEKDNFANSLGRRVPNNYAKIVVRQAHELYNLPDFSLNYSTVMSRVDRRNWKGLLGVEACIAPCIDVEEI